MNKVSFEEAGEPEIKLPIFTGSWREQGSFRKASSSVSVTMLKPLTVWLTTNWKILKEMGVPDHFTCLLRNCVQVKKKHLELDVGQWFKIGKGVSQVTYCHPAY